MKTIETPYGTITLSPITEEDMERMKRALLSDPELDLELEDTPWTLTLNA
jgi:hypothetical protein